MIDLTTTSGYRVSFKDFLDTRGYRAIQRATLARTEIHAGMSPDDISLTGDIGLDAEDVALREMILTVVQPDGSTAPDPVAAVGAMPYTDGAEVYAKVNDLTRSEIGDPKAADGNSSAS